MFKDTRTQMANATVADLVSTDLSFQDYRETAAAKAAVQPVVPVDAET